MWLLGIYVKSLHAYRKALGVDKYEWANKAEVGTLLSGAYPKSSRASLQEIIRRFEKTGILPPFNLITMQEIACTTDGIQVSKREKFNTTQSASHIPKLETSQYENQVQDITPSEFKRKLMQIHNSALINKTDFSSLTVPQMEAILQVINALNERNSSQDSKKGIKTENHNIN